MHSYWTSEENIFFVSHYNSTENAFQMSSKEIVCKYKYKIINAVAIIAVLNTKVLKIIISANTNTIYLDF